MTKEEAISILKERIDTYIVCHGEEDTVAISIDNVDVEAFDMAIKALELESCGDCVSREEVLKLAKDYGSKTYLIPILSVKALPPVLPTQDWIPVSERLPRTANTYLVTLQGTGELKGAENEVAFATWVNKDWIYHDVDNWQDKKVLAWMPTIKPYDGGVQNDKRRDEDY